MKPIHQSFFAALLFFVLALTGPVQAAEKLDIPLEKNAKVLLEVDSGDPAVWKKTVGMARQIMTILGMDNVQLEVMAWGQGVNMLMKNSPVADNVSSLSDYGITFMACGNTMKSLNISDRKLIDSVKVVYPGAIALILKRDHEGWTQIKM